MVVCCAAISAAATIAHAQAVVQEPKNGCTSPQVYGGSLTSPPFNPPSNAEPINFQGWFEVEGVNPGGFDQIYLEYTIDAGQSWVEIARLFDSVPPPTGGGNPDQPFSNRGLGVAPSFQQFNFTLPVGDGPTVQLRFRFDTGDDTYQGFRGVAIDQVTVGSSFQSLSENFEQGAPLWTFDPASGPGGPFWQVLSNPQNISVKSPEVNPDLVTLPDSGALPAAPEGSRVAWFGRVDSGTFCGPDFANRFQFPDTVAPETTITGGPPASTSSKTASLSFTSSEPGSFLCRLDGGPQAPCSSPQSYSALALGGHSFEVVAIDSAGNADPTPATHAWTVTPQTLADLPRPTRGEDVNVQASSGTVLVGIAGGAARTAGAHASQKGITFVPLAEARQIPVGSFLDTKRGTVELVSARTATRVQSGTFGAGLFQVLQSRRASAKGLTEMRLKGSSFNRCRTGQRGRSGSASAAQLSRRTIRRLRSNANGNFRTRGRHSAATVRGTVWITADRCDGTLTTVRRGRVAVRDFRRKRTITVRAGKTYLARAPG